MTKTIEFTPGRYCPIAGNSARFFRRDDFTVSCLALRDLAREKNQHIYKHCLECGADIPEAAEFVVINRAVIDQAAAEAAAPTEPQKPETSTPKETETMGKEEEKGRGTAVTCALCGRKRKLKKHYEKMVCTSCQFIQTEAKKRPDTLQAALEDSGYSFPSGLVEWKAADQAKKPASPDEDLLSRIQMLEERWNARIEVLERMAVKIGSLAGLAGLLTAEAKKIPAQDIVHHSV